MATIHPTAIISPQARIGSGVCIGPFCVIESDVEIGDSCSIAARVSVKTGTTLGAENVICEGAVLGGPPQHIHVPEEIGGLVVGRGNVFRENVTVHRALHPGEATRIGDHNMVMVNSHIAHDCVIGNQVIIANNCMLAGHVVVEDRAYLSGAVGIHQFCRVGRHAMVGGQSHINRDIAPFVTVDGDSSRVVGLNLIGLKRAGFDRQQLASLKAAYRLIFRSGRGMQEILVALEEQFHEPPTTHFAEFIRSSQRGIVPDRRGQRLTLRVADYPDDSSAERRAG